MSCFCCCCQNGLSLPYTAADTLSFMRLSSPRSIVGAARLDALQLAFRIVSCSMYLANGYC